MAEKRKKESGQGPTFNFSEKIEAGIINVGGEQTFNAPIVINLHSNLERSIQSIRAIPSADPATRNELTGLTGQLKAVLEQTPAGAEQLAERVAQRLNALLDEASAKKPNRESVKISADGLKKAAENLAGVVPSIIPICAHIIKLVLNL